MSLALYATLIATIFTSTAVSVDVQQQQIKRACTGAAQPASTPPSAGLVGVGTQHLFDMAGDIGLSIVRNHITSAHLGGFTTTVSAPLLGDVDITVHDAHLQRLNATTAAATTAPQPDGTVQLDLHGFSVHVRCPLAFRRRAWPHISGHATAHNNAHGGRATLVGNVTNEQGRPHVQLTHDAVVAFDDLDVRIADNKAAFLLNIVLLIAHGRVESAIQQEVQRQVGLQVPSLGNQVLQGLPVQADVLGIPLNISMQVHGCCCGCVHVCAGLLRVRFVFCTHTRVAHGNSAPTKAEQQNTSDAMHRAIRTSRSTPMSSAIGPNSPLPAVMPTRRTGVPTSPAPCPLLPTAVACLRCM